MSSMHDPRSLNGINDFKLVAQWDPVFCRRRLLIECETCSTWPPFSVSPLFLPQTRWKGGPTRAATKGFGYQRPSRKRSNNSSSQTMPIYGWRLMYSVLQLKNISHFFEHEWKITKIILFVPIMRCPWKEMGNEWCSINVFEKNSLFLYKDHQIIFVFHWSSEYLIEWNFFRICLELLYVFINFFLLSVSIINFFNSLWIYYLLWSSSFFLCPFLLYNLRIMRIHG